MAKTNAVWGIDIGQSSLKALRCTAGSDPDTVVASHYDFIEYTATLGDPDADPSSIIAEALETFLSRNKVTGDSVAISVPGQVGLSRFFKPPPIEVKKLPDIVKFEVKGQIPFPIEDVIWDWQQLGGGVDDDGKTVGAEIGLFAMKRDAVYRALKPFDDAEVEVDIVQLSPLSIYNVVCHDTIEEMPTPEDFDPENPPESIVVMSMGTDTTDLIVTNGIKLWMRNIPIGGSHFTKHLSRELKLTQAKAEHLKRNARMAENPKQVFQAMRPVFNDLVNEVQRSLTFFQSNEKTATIGEIVLLGNAAKLPGLRQFLSKQLEVDVTKASGFSHLEGDSVVGQSSFDENFLSFAPCYGLCLQGLSKSKIKTNLLPEELVVERVIRAKKPWVLASVGLLLLGCTLGLIYKGSAAWKVADDFEGVSNVSWKEAKQKADAEKMRSSSFVSTDEELKQKLTKFNKIAAELGSASENKSSWIELYSAIYQALPKDKKIEEALADGEKAIDPKKYPFAGREEIYIDHIETKYYKDIDTWITEAKPVYEHQGTKSIEDLVAATPVDPNSEYEAAIEDVPYDGEGETGPESGWVIEIQGHHFHNENSMDSERDYVHRTLLQNLNDGTVKLPDGEYKFSDLGIQYPTITRTAQSAVVRTIFLGGDTDVQDPMGGATGFAMPAALKPGDRENLYTVKDYNFILQMAWTPRTMKERQAAKTIREQTEAAALAAEAEAGLEAEDSELQ